jgi:structural maintenance of chromosome 4
LLKAIQEAAE